jgi:hypothetical protein
MSAVDELIEALEHRLKQARSAKRTFASNPRLSDDVALTLARAPLLNIPEVAARAGRKTNWQRVHEVLVEAGNSWLTVATVAERAGLNRGLVASALYVGHSWEVESKPHPSYLRIKVWRLRTPAGGEEKKSDDSGFSS